MYGGQKRQRFHFKNVKSQFRLEEEMFLLNHLNLQNVRETRSNWARKVREFSMFNVQCSMFNVQCSMFNVHVQRSVYCVLWERLSELRVWRKRIMRGFVIFCCGQRDGTGRETRGVLRGPHGPKNMTSNSCSVRPEKFHPYTCISKERWKGYEVASWILIP